MNRNHYTAPQVLAYAVRISQVDCVFESLDSHPHARELDERIRLAHKRGFLRISEDGCYVPTIAGYNLILDTHDFFTVGDPEDGEVRCGNCDRRPGRGASVEVCGS